MRLARYRIEGRQALGVIEDDSVIDLSGAFPDLASVEQVIEKGERGLDAVRDFCCRRPADFALAEVELLQPILSAGKYLAIGLNYRSHAEEARFMVSQPAARQYWFNKQITCLSGPFAEIDPGVSKQVDYEVELGVVIGKPAKGVSAASALDFVFGYFVANDVSARDWQAHAPSFTVGKSFDTHGPIGPWIVTADEIGDPQALDLKCWVNGELRQSSNTSEMLYTVAEQIEYLSTAFTLMPGDLLATGTPEGVGMARQPPEYLKPGDVVRCEVQGIGAIENRIGPGTDKRIR
ncbi:fumarylacetoacetate hydrolase family protein [Sphingopyxis indica]|uniref:fumarylacetoacetate hydrolase family protein n=1 Tax=Sphingopyxis indica TaxID=436663 RepID=UPI0029392C4B|nr:fumarylacetoacetate hydrolase family protein [Sphingopyxis indica]WOF44746.1 fumarylacetoacetate hydrolase family protein [Sphingopyxis indica]